MGHAGYGKTNLFKNLCKKDNSNSNSNSDYDYIIEDEPKPANIEVCTNL